MTTADNDDVEKLRQRALRRCFGQFATGVTVITAAVGGELVGITANSFSSVSLTPPLVLWSINRGSKNLAAFQKAGGFAINILAASQTAISSRFATSEAGKFEGVDWRPGHHGSPVLAGTAAVFECSTVQMIEAGDHYIVVGQIENFDSSDADLLVFAKGRYGLFTDHPVNRSTATPAVTPPQYDYVQLMLRLAHGRYTGAFQADREAEGFAGNQSRLLFSVERNPGASLDYAGRVSFLSPDETEACAAELVAKGYATRTGDTLSATEEGRRRLEGVRVRARAFDAAQFADIPADDVAAFRRVLRRLVDGQPK